FMDTPNSLGISLFNRQTTLPASFGYQTTGKGGTIAYGYRLGRFDNISFIYGYERARSHYETTEAPDNLGNVPLPSVSDFVYTTSSVNPAYRYDSRDNPFDTTRGSRLSLSLGFSGGPLGGTINLLKPQVNYTRFTRLSRKTSVSLNLEGDYIFPLDDEKCVHTYIERTQAVPDLCVPIGERFLVG